MHNYEEKNFDSLLKHIEDYLKNDEKTFKNTLWERIRQMRPCSFKYKERL